MNDQEKELKLHMEDWARFLYSIWIDPKYEELRKEVLGKDYCRQEE